MNICLTCDKAYLKYALVTITSILENNRNGFINFYIMCTHDVTEEYYSDAIEKLKNKYSNFEIEFVPMTVDTTAFQLNEKSLFNETLLYRLFIPETFPSLDRMLYLDSDIIVRHDITEFYNTEFNECHYIAGVGEDYSYYGRPPPMTYINAGVVLMDLNRCRSFGFTTKTLAVLKYRCLPYFDQDAINLVCNGKIKLVDPTYNYCNWTSGMSSSKQKSPTVVHFARTFKKVLEGQHISHADEWWKYAKMSPMADQIKQPRIRRSWYY